MSSGELGGQLTQEWFITELGSRRRSKVMRTVSLDGSRVRTLVDGRDEFPDGVVVDSQRGHIYWANTGT